MRLLQMRLPKLKHCKLCKSLFVVFPYKGEYPKKICPDCVGKAMQKRNETLLEKGTTPPYGQQLQDGFDLKRGIRNV